MEKSLEVSPEYLLNAKASTVKALKKRAVQNQKIEDTL